MCLGSYRTFRKCLPVDYYTYFYSFNMGIGLFSRLIYNVRGAVCEATRCSPFQVGRETFDRDALSLG